MLLDCPIDGFLVQETGITVEGDSNVEFIELTATCPGCGEMRQLVSTNVVSTFGHAATVRLKPTTEQSARLRRDLVRAQNLLQFPDRIEEAQTIVSDSLAKNAKGIAKVMDWIVSPSGMAAAAWLSVLIPLLLFMLTAAEPLDEADVVRLVSETVATLLSEQDAAAPEPPISPAEFQQNQDPPPPATDIPTPRTH